MGPRFKGSREDLLFKEELKIRCMLSLIHRGMDIAYMCLEKCSSAVWELDEEVRASYVEKIELKQQELAKMMLLDGCFLLELLVSNSKKLNSKFPSRLYPPCPTAELLNDEDVLSDLMLFENQIPILVLHKLSQTIFPEEFEPDLEGVWNQEQEQEQEQEIIRTREQRAKKINNLTLSVLGYSPLDSPCPEAPHILDLVHFYVNRWTIKSTTSSTMAMQPMLDEDHSKLDITNTTQIRQTLKRCALRLLTSGVVIKVIRPLDKDTTGFGGLSCLRLVMMMLFKILNKVIVNRQHLDFIHEEVEVKGLDFHFEFEKGKLEIEQLHITKTTKAKWCNLIAWENHKKYKDHSGFADEADERQHNTITSHGGGGKFTWAALIFNGLICSEDDVQLLKDKSIIVDHLNMSNKDLMEFFRKIQFGIAHGVVDSSSYAQMVDDINNFTKAFFIKRIWSTVVNSFTYRQEWIVRFMNQNYNFVATVISLCTVVQTIYAIIAYQLPKE